MISKFSFFEKTKNKVRLTLLRSIQNSIQKFKFFSTYRQKKESNEVFFKRVLLIAFLFYVTVLCLVAQPQDDYWRHLLSAKGISYESMYYNAKLPSFNPWIGYDLFLSFVEKLAGKNSYLVIYFFTSGIFSLAYYRITSNVSNDLRLVFYLLLMFLLSSRIETARPTILVGALFSLAWVVDSWKIRLAITFLVVPAYWFYFLYLIPLLLKDRKVVIPILAGLLFWTCYGRVDYFKELYRILTFVQNRDLPIAENLPLYEVLLSPFAIAFLPLAYLIEKYGLLRALKLDLKSLIALVYWSLFNQIRFFGDAMVFILISYVRFFELEGKVKLPTSLVLASFLVLFLIPVRSSKIDYESLSKIKPYLEGKKILIVSDVSFRLTYELFPAKVAPPMEVKYLDDQTYALLTLITVNKTVDCQLLKKTKTEVLVEEDLSSPTPECLELLWISNKVRFWKVKYQEGEE